MANGDTFLNEQQTAFARQTGTGVIHAVGDCMTLDLGYRYSSVSPVSACDCGDLPGDYTSQFVSDELLLTVRMHGRFAAGFADVAGAAGGRLTDWHWLQSASPRPTACALC